MFKPEQRNCVDQDIGEPEELEVARDKRGQSGNRQHGEES
jgi:hypothetical protein